MFKKKYPWNVEESLEAMRILEDELSRLHCLVNLIRKDPSSRDSLGHIYDARYDLLLDEIASINNYRLMVAKRIAGFEY